MTGADDLGLAILAWLAGIPFVFGILLVLEGGSWLRDRIAGWFDRRNYARFARERARS